LSYKKILALNLYTFFQTPIYLFSNGKFRWNEKKCGDFEDVRDNNLLVFQPSTAAFILALGFTLFADADKWQNATMLL